MSVLLFKLAGARGKFDDVEVMAPDYDVERIWLWDCPDGENRIDLSREQMATLRDVLDEYLGKARRVRG